LLLLRWLWRGLRRCSSWGSSWGVSLRLAEPGRRAGVAGRGGEWPSGPYPGHMAVALAPLTTLGLGGPAPRVDTARSPGELAELLGAADRAGGALVLGGGSNVVIADAGIEMPVVR